MKANKLVWSDPRKIGWGYRVLGIILFAVVYNLFGVVGSGGILAGAITYWVFFYAQLYLYKRTKRAKK